MGKKKIKCRTCGQMFEPKSPDDFFCSPVCRITGCYVGGGGDTRKPMSEEQRKALAKKGQKDVAASSRKATNPRKVRNGAEKFPRVHYMFSLPIEQRWAVASQFTPEESEYSLRLQKKMLQEEKRLDEMLDWDCGACEESVGKSYEGLLGGRLGESDDGSV